LNIPYLVPRITRHFLPDGLVRFLLRRSLIIRPGLETRSPFEAADRYLAALSETGCSIKGRQVLVFGYGGSYAVACALLKAGAGHITLCEYEAPPDDRRNQALLPDFSQYLLSSNGSVTPNPEYITLAMGDIRQILKGRRFDVVLSTSVFEHLVDVEGITTALARMTAKEGIHLHYVDLRDHFFKYPFEMLCYSKQIWYGWLNPSSHHNRWRLPEYQRLFASLFSTVKIEVLERDQDSFEKAKARIRPEFLSGDANIDAVTLIKILARAPLA
jgi:hypothetical protein